VKAAKSIDEPPLSVNLHTTELNISFGARNVDIDGKKVVIAIQLGAVLERSQILCPEN